MMDETDSQEPHWQQVGTYHVTESWRFFRSLEKAEVEFRFTPLDPHANADAVAIAYGGFGMGSQLLVEVWSEDAELFHTIHEKYFGAQDEEIPEEPEDRGEKDDWRDRLR